MIGVLGGTFDPVHLGHLRLALELSEQLNFEQVRFIPCGQPPHRAAPQADVETRAALLGATLTPPFVLDRRELDRAGPSYTVDTLGSLRAEYPHTPLCLIVGMDSYARLPTWSRWTEIIALAHLVVVARPGTLPPDHPALNTFAVAHATRQPSALHHNLAGSLWFAPVVGLDISATRIRAALAAGRSARFLVPDAVCDLIARQGLYRRAA